MAFTPEMQRNGGLAKGRNAAALRAKSDRVWEIVRGMEAEQIPEIAYAAALALMRDAAERGPGLPMESRLDLQRTAEAASTLFKIARLASGESTSNTATINANSGDLDAIAERLARLRALQRGTDTPSE